MNKKILGAALLTALPMGAASAATGYLQYGGGNATSLTTRAAGLSAVTGNPAAGHNLLREGQNFRTGIFSIPQFGAELGPVDNFTDDVDEFQDRFEQLEEDFDNAQTQQELDQARADGAQLFADFRPVLTEISDAAFLNLDFQQQIPLTPAVFRALGGVFTVNLSADVKMKLRTVGADIFFVDDQKNRVADDSDQADDISTDLAAFVKAGAFGELAVGYSRELPLAGLLPLPEGLRLSAGGRLKVVQGVLSKAVARVQDDEDDNGNEEDDTAMDRALDNFDDRKQTTTSFGVDVGVMGEWKGFYGGLTVFNLIAPEFDYPELGGDCDAIYLDKNSGAYKDCEAENSFGDQVGLTETYSDDTRLHAELGYRILESNWVIGGALDLNKVESVVGDEFQWASLTAGYESQNWWLPGFTLGLRQNLAGSELSFATASVGLLRVMRINLSYGLEQAEHEDESVPRGLAVGIGFEMPI